MGAKILVLFEHRDGEIQPVSWEALSLGQGLAQQLDLELTSVLIGSQVEDLALQVSSKSGGAVIVVDHERAGQYSPEAYCEIVAELVRREPPFLVLMGHTYQVMDFAPRLAARLDCEFVPNCIKCECADGRISFIRQVYAGKLNLRVAIQGNAPCLVSVQPGAFSGSELQSSSSARLIRLDVPLPERIFRRKILAVIRETQRRVDLSRAEIIVAGGRGMGSREGFQVVLDLAEALGAEVGASRPATDAGWVAKERQIGSSGQTVAPRLYIACAISGAVQHVVGLSNAGCVVAINKDPQAPIFSIADFGIVGDVFEVAPLLTPLMREIRK